MGWIPTTESDRAAMLEVIGAASIDELFETIPEALRLRAWDVPPEESEMAVRRGLEALAARNSPACVTFLGGGFYDHFIPAAVDALSSRGEFYTAYTPYQPECAQGTLQAIYEYQSAICRLTDLECANASLYDGGTAIFEAAMMSIRLTQRRRLVCHPSLNPIYRGMLGTHAANLGLEIRNGDAPDGAACVIVQNPAFSGAIEDFTGLAERCHSSGALLVLSFCQLPLQLVPKLLLLLSAITIRECLPARTRPTC